MDFAEIINALAEAERNGINHGLTDEEIAYVRMKIDRALKNLR